MSITLTPDQQVALTAMNTFLADPKEEVFVLSGYSGTGKSTLIKTFLKNVPTFMKALMLIDPAFEDFNMALTATTNKAAENFAHITNEEVKTIHSFLGLRVQTNYETGVTTLIPRKNVFVENTLIFIDEASYVDAQLMTLIFKLTKRCKIIFIGDPAQLTPVKSVTTPVFNAKFNGAHLSQVVRQATGNPIVELATKFRHTVNTGDFFSFVPDGVSVKHMPRADFNKAIEAEFIRSDWKYLDSKVLAWTNKVVIAYNHSIRDHVLGDPHFQVGDYAVCNKFINDGKQSIKTDQLVQITAISNDHTNEHGVLGNFYTLDYSGTFFAPKSLADKKAFIKQAKAAENYNLVALAEDRWVDLRAAYACTINKAQGSTYERVFIDLDDIRKCNSGDQIARMMYVAVSRARYKVFLTGDLV